MLPVVAAGGSAGPLALYTEPRLRILLHSDTASGNGASCPSTGGSFKVDHGIMIVRMRFDSDVPPSHGDRTRTIAVLFPQHSCNLEYLCGSAWAPASRRSESSEL